MNRKIKFGPNEGKDIPYLEKFLKRFSEGNRPLIRNKIIFFNKVLTTKFKLKNALNADYDHIEFFFDQSDFFIEFYIINKDPNGTLRRKLIHAFEFLAKTTDWYFVDWMLVKRYAPKDSKVYNPKHAGTVGIVFHLQWMGSITLIDKASAKMDRIVKGQFETHKHYIDRYHIYLADDLNGYGSWQKEIRS